MSKRNHQIHDKFVKASFSDKDRAAVFFEKFLPESCIADLDLSTLEIKQESYIQDDLREYFSDIVFEVQSKDGIPLNLSIILEHKSRPDKYAVIQLAYYIFAHWYKCIREKRVLKPIIPVLYYQGKKKWKQPKIIDVFPKELGGFGNYIPWFDYIFISLNSLDELQIAQIRNGFMAAAILAQKKGFDVIKLADELQKILEVLPIEMDQGNFIKQIFVYLFSVSEFSDNEIQKVITYIPKPIKENMMTTYNRIKAEGKAEGIAEGKAKGIVEGKAEIVLAMYADKIPIEQIVKYTNLSVEQINDILKTVK